MKNELTRSNENRFAVADVDAMTTQEIVEAFQSLVNEIYLKITEAAYLLMELEKRKFNWRSLRATVPIVEHVHNVGASLLAKEAFARWFERPILLRTLATLPLTKQQELAESGSVQVFDHVKGNGTHRLLEIDELSPQEMSLVFDTKAREVRTPEQQAKFLASRGVKERIMRAEITHDERTGLLTIKNASPEQIRAYMKKNGL